MDSKYDTIIDSFMDHTFGVDDHFLPDEMTAGLQQHILELERSGSFKAAHIGNAVNPDWKQKKRNDQVYWLDDAHDNEFERSFLTHIKGFVTHLNATCYTGINAWEFHYAVYDPGSFYKRHKDQFRNNTDRKFSLISYLNEDWLEKDGGELCVYPEAGMQMIRPEKGKAVFFRSDELEHEVVRSNRKRMSVTGWLKQI